MRKKEPGTFCPMIKKDCVESKCVWYTQIRGNNPQTGQEIDEHGCAIAWLPILMIENSQQQRQTGAAVESFRNEMVKTQNDFLLLVNNSRRNELDLSHDQKLLTYQDLPQINI